MLCGRSLSLVVVNWSPLSSSSMTLVAVLIQSSSTISWWLPLSSSLMGGDGHRVGIAWTVVVIGGGLATVVFVSR